MTRLDAFDPGLIAADYVTAALGAPGAHLALVALRAGWLTEDEADVLRPLAVGLAQILGVDLPTHRGRLEEPWTDADEQRIRELRELPELTAAGRLELRELRHRETIEAARRRRLSS